MSAALVTLFIPEKRVETFDMPMVLFHYFFRALTLTTLKINKS